MRIPALAVVFSLLALPALAQLTPRGDELQLNTNTDLNQQSPAISRTDQGFVVAWSSSSSPGTDLDASIVARRFNADGGPIGDDFQVNSFTTSNQITPSIGTAADGSFVVVWSCASCPLGTDTSRTSIQGRRFASDGTPIGDEFQINSITEYAQRNPAVAVADNGEFVVVWDTELYSSSYVTSIRARHFAANGVPTLDDFTLQGIGNTNLLPSVAVDEDGKFVAAWSTCPNCGYGLDFNIAARRLDSDGTLVGTAFQVNAPTASYQLFADVDFDAAGNFVVVWSDQPGYYAPSNKVSAKRFSAEGTALGDEISLSDSEVSINSQPSVAVAPTGEFLVTWNSDTSNGDDNFDRSIQQQLFDAAGMPVGANLQVNTYTTGDQGPSAVAVDSKGRFIVSWSSPGSSGDDDSGLSIQGQRFFNGIFADSFESGDLTGWSSSTP